MSACRIASICLSIVLAHATACVAEDVPKTLEQCVAIAVAQHPSLRSANASVQAGDARIWEATSTYLPQISGLYTADRRNSSAGAQTGSNLQGGSQTFDFYRGNVSLSQVLFDFGQNLHSILSAQAADRSLRADATTQRETVVLNVKQSYFNLLAAKRLLIVADETVGQDQKHLEQAQGRFQVGLAAKFDVTQAQVQLANAELNQITGRNNVALGRQTLRNAMGVTDPIEFDIVDTLDVHGVHITEAEALALAYDNRPEILSVHAQEESADQQVAALQASHLPVVRGNAYYQWTGSHYPLQPGWDIGASINVPIFSGGLIAAQVNEAKANLAKLHFDEETLRQSIALQVRQALLNLQQAAESIRVAEKGLQLARENLELAEARYSTGVGSIIEVTDAQTSRTSASASHVQALYTYTTSVAAIEKATAKELVLE